MDLLEKIKIFSKDENFKNTLNLVIEFLRKILRGEFEFTINYMFISDHLSVDEVINVARERRFLVPRYFLEKAKESCSSPDLGEGGFINPIDGLIFVCIKTDRPPYEFLHIIAHEFSHYQNARNMAEIYLWASDLEKHLIKVDEIFKYIIEDAADEVAEGESFRPNERMLEIFLRWVDEVMAEYVSFNYFVFLNKSPELSTSDLEKLSLVLDEYRDTYIDMLWEEVGLIAAEYYDDVEYLESVIRFSLYKPEFEEMIKELSHKTVNDIVYIMPATYFNMNRERYKILFKNVEKLREKIKEKI